MNSISLISIVVIGIAVTLKLFYSLYKKDVVNEKHKHNLTNDEAEKINLESSKERFGKIESYEESLKNKYLHPTDEFEEMERPEISQKNKWLYPTDGFGKMEHGVVGDETKEGHKKGKKVLRLRKIEKE